MIASEGGRRIRDDDIVVEANVRSTVASGSIDKVADCGLVDGGIEETWAFTGSPPTEAEAATCIWSVGGDERVDELCILLRVRDSVFNAYRCP